MTLEECVDWRVVQIGSVRGLADLCDLNAGYVSRLRSGEKVNPGEETLEALGLERIVTYRLREDWRAGSDGSEG